MKVPEIEEIVAYGKIVTVLPLHYLLYEEESPLGEPGFTGLCMDLGVFSWARSADEAHEQLNQSIFDYMVKQAKSKSGMLDLFNQLADPFFEAHWGCYRQLTFLCGDPNDEYIEELGSDLREMKEELMEIRVDHDGLKKELQAKRNQTKAWDLPMPDERTGSIGTKSDKKSMWDFIRSIFDIK